MGALHVRGRGRPPLERPRAIEPISSRSVARDTARARSRAALAPARAPRAGASTGTRRPAHPRRLGERVDAVHSTLAVGSRGGDGSRSQPAALPLANPAWRAAPDLLSRDAQGRSPRRARALRLARDARGPDRAAGRPGVPDHG